MIYIISWFSMRYRKHNEWWFTTAWITAPLLYSKKGVTKVKFSRVQLYLIKSMHVQMSSTKCQPFCSGLRCGYVRSQRTHSYMYLSCTWRSDVFHHCLRIMDVNHWGEVNTKVWASYKTYIRCMFECVNTQRNDLYTRILCCQYRLQIRWNFQKNATKC